MEKGRQVYEQTRARFAGNPALGKTTIRAVARLLEDMHIEGRVGKFYLEADEPAVRGGTDLGPILDSSRVILKRREFCSLGYGKCSKLGEILWMIGRVLFMDETSTQKRLSVYYHSCRATQVEKISLER